jgi:hypothetical protein
MRLARLLPEAGSGMDASDKVQAFATLPGGITSMIHCCRLSLFQGARVWASGLRGRAEEG